uniref:Neur_chan_memb domain-containing protein n=1 Tax=Steinernema glaseri TaxID=37863 RepID=A0A1I7Z5B1_9BILA
MKFGGWSYNGFLLDVRQIPSGPNDIIETRHDENGKEYQYLEQGMDLSSFYPSLEWDLMYLNSMRHEQLYPGCCGQEFYIDISFDIALRRKTLFYTVNLVIPCMLIVGQLQILCSAYLVLISLECLSSPDLTMVGLTILTTFVFYIPACEHKVSYAISILVTLTVFYLVLIELIPPTSLVIPLIGKYLLFTMFLVSASILLSVVTLNYYRRDGTAHPMPGWMHHIFLRILPRYLCIKPPKDDDGASDDGSSMSDLAFSLCNSRRASPYFLNVAQVLAQLRGMHPDLIRRMIDNVAFIADHFRAQSKEGKVSEDWSYVAMVIDRLMLIIFTVVNIVGTTMIITQSPTLYDFRPPMTISPPTKPLTGDTFEYGLANWTFS